MLNSIVKWSIQPEISNLNKSVEKQKDSVNSGESDSLVEKESYKWVEALIEVDKQVEANTRVIHIFDREGDIAEVFDHRSG